MKKIMDDRDCRQETLSMPRSKFVKYFIFCWTDSGHSLPVEIGDFRKPLGSKPVNGVRTRASWSLVSASRMSTGPTRVKGCSVGKIGQ